MVSLPEEGEGEPGYGMRTLTWGKGRPAGLACEAGCCSLCSCSAALAAPSRALAAVSAAARAAVSAGFSPLYFAARLRMNSLGRGRISLT